MYVEPVHGKELAAPHRSSMVAPHAELKETHSSLVFLIGDRAYKLKKSVDLGFLDFSTREKRLEALRCELRLNRRLAPDVYLGISDVTGVDGRLMDHLLVMRRMPDQRRLAHLVRSGADVDRELRAIAHLVASFHSTCVSSPQISAEGGRDALRGRWECNAVESEPYVGSQLDAATFVDVRRLAGRYLDGRGALFEDRVRGGAIVDGHGDLLAEDIFCLPDGPRVLDCLEFDDRLRYLDRLDDVACLAMDLERLGSAAAAEAFVAAYVKNMGEVSPDSLVHHYIAYRAFMRAKVACLSHVGGHAGDDPQALLDLADAHLDQARVGLILVGGPPGTGKTTLAGALADALDCVVLSSDRIRKELAGLSPETPQAAPLEEGIYTTPWTQRTYAELLARAERLLSRGESVVLDATWSRAADRELAAAVAERTSSDLSAFRCDAPLDLVETRLSGRSSVSDADLTVAAAIRTCFDNWPSAIEVDTAAPLPAVVDRVRHRVQPWRTTVSLVRPRMAPD